MNGQKSKATRKDEYEMKSATSEHDNQDHHVNVVTSKSLPWAFCNSPPPGYSQRVRESRGFWWVLCSEFLNLGR